MNVDYKMYMKNAKKLAKIQVVKLIIKFILILMLVFALTYYFSFSSRYLPDPETSYRNVGSFYILRFSMPIILLLTLLAVITAFRRRKIYFEIYLEEYIKLYDKLKNIKPNNSYIWIDNYNFNIVRHKKKDPLPEYNYKTLIDGVCYEDEELIELTQKNKSEVIVTFIEKDKEKSTNIKKLDVKSGIIYIPKYKKVKNVRKSKVKTKLDTLEVRFNNKEEKIEIKLRKVKINSLMN